MINEMVSEKWMLERQVRIAEFREEKYSLYDWNCRHAKGQTKQIHEHRMRIQKMFKYKKWMELDSYLTRYWDLARIALGRYLEDLPQLDYHALAQKYSQELNSTRKINQDLCEQIVDLRKKIAGIEELKQKLRAFLKD